MIEQRQELRFAFDRARRSGSDATDVSRTLMATSRQSFVSRARYTSPMPPAPRGAAISYVPRRVPGASATGNGCDYGRWDNLNGLVIENAVVASVLIGHFPRQ